MQASNRLLQALTEAQQELIQGSDTHRLFNKLLGVLLQLTDSEYGFIGEVLRKPDGAAYLRAHAITNIAWTDELRQLYDQKAALLGLEFHNHRSLFGVVLTTGEPVVSNTPASDPRRGGLPPGHPELRAFLGLPFKSGGELVGMVGLANRPEGYDAEIIGFLQPVLSTCCTILLGWRSEHQRRHAEELLRQSEEELRRHHAQLEELVQSRTQKLLRTTQELEQRQVQLIQSERQASLGQLVSGLAHELNNPLGYLTSNLATLTQYNTVFTRLLGLYRELETALGPDIPLPATELLARIRTLQQEEDLNYLLDDVGELLHDSREGANRVKEIVQNLRSFVREDSGRQQLVDVNKELATTLKVLWNELKYRCEVRCDYGEVPPVLGNPTQLNQVFTNLLLNAAQSIAERGEIHLTTAQDGGEVLVCIADTGHGMTPEVLSKLFTPFFTTRAPGKGTGLGLSISQDIITRHQGRIDVKSQPGQGSTFTVRLPVARES
jgi:signal transduction histidine kinase